jgi:hypothetical protein
MVRKQVYIEPGQDALLKRQAAQLGVTEAELIRRAIDQAGAAPRGLPADQDAWAKAKSIIQERLGITVPQTGRSWTREELYEERLERPSR